MVGSHPLHIPDQVDDDTKVCRDLTNIPESTHDKDHNMEVKAPSSEHQELTECTETCQVKNINISTKMTSIATQTTDLHDTLYPNFVAASSGSANHLLSVYNGEWPIALCKSSPNSLAERHLNTVMAQDIASVLSFSSSVTSSPHTLGRKNPPQLGAKVEMVYSLLSLLGTDKKVDVSKTLLAMSSSADNCIAMRDSGCLPLLVQILHSTEKFTSTEDFGDDPELIQQAIYEEKYNASQALHNIVHVYASDTQGHREMRILKLLEQIRNHCNHFQMMKSSRDEDIAMQLPVAAVRELRELSFDEEHRHSIFQLGGLQAIAELIQVEYEGHRSAIMDQNYAILLHDACTVLNNLSFSDGTNRTLLCSIETLLRCLLCLLHSPNEELQQVTASVLRNLCSGADNASMQTLRDVGAVGSLMKAAMETTKEQMLKTTLSALWNLSAHCSANIVDICAIEGALAFLVSTLSFKSPTKTLSVIKKGGGILKNVSSHVAVREDYRAILRKHKCFQILLQHLNIPSLTVVSNACGALWNLSAHCAHDQQILWDLGAVDLLRKLVHSKHRRISLKSSAALKNLLSARSQGNNLGLKSLLCENKEKPTTISSAIIVPSIQVTKAEPLKSNIDPNIEVPVSQDMSVDSKTAEEYQFGFKNNLNVRSTSSLSSDCEYLPGRMYSSLSGGFTEQVSRSSSHDSINSTHSEPVHLQASRSPFHILRQSRRLLASEHKNYKENVERKSMKANTVDNCCQILPLGYKHCLSDVSIKQAANAQSSGSYRFHKDPQAMVSSNFVRRCYNAMCDTTVNDHYLGISRGNNYGYQSYATLAEKIQNYEESEAQDQPIDYSLRYSEKTLLGQAAKTQNPRHTDRQNESKIDLYIRQSAKLETISKHLNQTSRPCELWTLKSNQGKQVSVSTSNCIQVQDANPVLSYQSSEQNDNFPVLYDSYAETDLDQPTNYSLVYNEDMDTTENYKSIQVPKNDNKYYSASGDLKNVPFSGDSVKVYCTEDTPINFSTASSLCDLRELASNHLSNNSVVCGDSASSQIDGQRVTFSNYKPNDGNTEVKKVQKVNSEKEPSLTKSQEAADEQASDKATSVLKKRNSQSEKEGKTVTFGEYVDFAEETPLMFSRSSSLGSLSSFEQHSIHDDRSSVISDFSRRASEVVSPSDLPDSPTQSVPPSPHRIKQSAFDFTNKPPESETNVIRPKASTVVKACSANEQSVFEDSKKMFAEEGEYSRCTSLSSLVIEEETCKFMPTLQHAIEEEGANDILSKSEESPVQSGKGVDESGVPSGDDLIESPQNNSHESIDLDEEGSGSLTDKADVPDARERNISVLSKSSATASPVKSNGTKSKEEFSLSSHPTSFLCSAKQMADSTDPTMFEQDSVKVYNTEGTPSFLSHATSLSELSMLSFDDPSKKSQKSQDNFCNDNSDDSSVCDQRILPECTQAGISTYKVPYENFESDKTGAVENVSSEMPPVVNRSLPEACDFPRVYEVEGTPVIFSRCDSLSSISCEGEDPIKLMKYAHSRADDGHFHDNPKFVASLEKENVYGEVSTPFAAHLPIDRQDIDTCKDEAWSSKSGYDCVCVYEVEGTPIVFSRSDSLSSIGCNDENHVRTESISHQKTGVQSEKLDSHKVEDCANSSFTSDNVGAAHQVSPQSHDSEGIHNSSFSSLYSNMSGDELSQSERALLEKCINAGMPKSKSNNFNGPYANKILDSKMQKTELNKIRAMTISAIPNSYKQQTQNESIIPASNHSSIAPCSKPNASNDNPFIEQVQFQKCVQSCGVYVKSKVAIDGESYKASQETFKINFDNFRSKLPSFNHRKPIPENLEAPHNHCSSKSFLSPRKSGFSHHKRSSSCHRGDCRECLESGNKSKFRQRNGFFLSSRPATGPGASLMSPPMSEQGHVTEFVGKRNVKSFENVNKEEATHHYNKKYGDSFVRDGKNIGVEGSLSRHSSLSNLSIESTDELTLEEKVLLQECINAGMPKAKQNRSQNCKDKSVPMQKPVGKETQTAPVCSKGIAAVSNNVTHNCLNKYPKQNKVPPLMDAREKKNVNDCKVVEERNVQPFEDTKKLEARTNAENGGQGKSLNAHDSLSRHSSLSNLSIESTDELTLEEEALLQQCINAGMPKAKQNRSQNCKDKLVSMQKSVGKETQPASVCSKDYASINFAEHDNLVLNYSNECLEQKKIPFTLRNECEKMSINVGGTLPQSSSLNNLSTDELSKEERALLRQCINAGMPKPKQTRAQTNTGAMQKKIGLTHSLSNKVNKYSKLQDLNFPSDTRDKKNIGKKELSINSSLTTLSIESADELSVQEKTLLQECINAGMPKARENRIQNTTSKSFTVQEDIGSDRLMLQSSYASTRPVYDDAHKIVESKDCKRRNEKVPHMNGARSLNQNFKSCKTEKRMPSLHSMAPTCKSGLHNTNDLNKLPSYFSKEKSCLETRTFCEDGGICYGIPHSKSSRSSPHVPANSFLQTKKAKSLFTDPNSRIMKPKFHTSISKASNNSGTIVDCQQTNIPSSKVPSSFSKPGNANDVCNLNSNQPFTFSVLRTKWQNSKQSEAMASQFQNVKVPRKSEVHLSTASSVPPLPAPFESPHTYEVEGTPVTFSRCDSLSSISSEGEDSFGTERPSNSNQVERSVEESEKIKGIHGDESSRKPSSYKTSELAMARPATGPGASPIALQDPLLGQDQQNAGAQGLHSKASSKSREERKSDKVAPGSRCNSPNNLSVNSVDELSPSERALLEKCINAGMPKAKQNSNKTSKNSQLYAKKSIRHNEVQPNICSEKGGRSLKSEKLEDGKAANVKTLENSTRLEDKHHLADTIVNKLKAAPISSSNKVHPSSIKTNNADAHSLSYDDKVVRNKEQNVQHVPSSSCQESKEVAFTNKCIRMPRKFGLSDRKKDDPVQNAKPSSKSRGESFMRIMSDIRRAVQHAASIRPATGPGASPALPEDKTFNQGQSNSSEVQGQNKMTAGTSNIPKLERTPVLQRSKGSKATCIRNDKMASNSQGLPLSQSSSVSNVSGEGPDELTPQERALLEECINAGMPKPKEKRNKNSKGS